MIKIIGNKDEINSLIDAINNTNAYYFTSPEYVEQEKDVFRVECKYNRKYLEYMVILEYDEKGE